MKPLHVELPDKVADEIQALVRGGWFRSEEELVRHALTEFVRQNRLELMEKQQLEDIEWGLRHATATGREVR